MGTDNIAKKIDLVVMTGSVPFITAGILQQGDADATLISGALSGMSNMFQEMLQQGELRHSELYNAHVYIRHLSQMNDQLGLISPEIQQNTQMRVAIIVREGELTREQELALSELCYSIMVKICEQPKFAKKLVKGNIEGYTPTPKETFEILNEAIKDYRKRAKKSLFYENANFLQEKDRFIALPINDELLTNQINQFILWLENQYYPPFFPRIPFVKFFGKLEYAGEIKQIKKTFDDCLEDEVFKEKISTELYHFILQSGLMPLVSFSNDLLERIKRFYEKELLSILIEFVENLISNRGPLGIAQRVIHNLITDQMKSTTQRIGLNFLENYLNEMGSIPFEEPLLKQFCQIIENYNLQIDFIKAIFHSSKNIVPDDYLIDFAEIINSNFKKRLDLDELFYEMNKNADLKPSLTPGLPTTDIIDIKTEKRVKASTKKINAPTKKKEKMKKTDIELPKASPECSYFKLNILDKAISETFGWIHEYVFGKIDLSKKNMPLLSNEGLFFYNITESLTIEMGLIFDLIQSYSGPRTWLIGQLNRIIESVENKIKEYDSSKGQKYENEKKLTIDVQFVSPKFRIIAERIISIITQLENDILKGKITNENKKSYLETGFLGRVQEVSIPQAKKYLEELKSINKTLSNNELDDISKATGINYKELTTNVTSQQLQTIPFPSRESDYSKEIREIIVKFKKWDIDIYESFRTIFRISKDIKDTNEIWIHEKTIDNYLRNNLKNNINQKLALFSDSDAERRDFMNSCFVFKEEFLALISNRLLYNKPLEIFSQIKLEKMKDQELYYKEYSPIKPPQLSEDIMNFFLLKYNKNDEENDNPIIVGRIYSYKIYNDDKITNLTELIMSDAFRRVFESVDEGIKTLLKIGKKIHGGIPYLLEQIIKTYNVICSNLSCN